MNLKMGRKISFEIKHKDVAGRIGEVTVGGKVIETPTLMPVYNPDKSLISTRELAREFNAEIIMTNAYLLSKKGGANDKVKKIGVHKFLGFDGVVATDSGSFQLMNYGAVDTTNKGIIDFQGEIGSDIGSFLDIPTLPDAYKPIASEQLKTTLKRAREAREAGFVVNAGVQGGKYLDLRRKAAKALGKNFDVVAVGGIVPLMEAYRFPELVNVIACVKKNIPSNRVVHAFGLGHPMAFALAVGLGCDLFDSAAYALYAYDGRYMTADGTRRLDELEYLPCSCPVCLKHGVELKNFPEQEKTKELAKHNLYVSFEEIRRIKQAIVEGRLWELIAGRCRSHPKLLAGLASMMEHTTWMSEFDPITKKGGFYYTGCESEKRTEVVNARTRAKRVKSEKTMNITPFGEIPQELYDIYPFGSAMGLEETQKPNVGDIEKINAIMDYQFGRGAGKLIPKGARIKRSRNTGRIRWVYEGKTLIAAVRAHDHFIIPQRPLVERLHKRFKKPHLRVCVSDPEVASFIREGKSVFAKFVSKIDMKLRAGDEVLVVDDKDNLLGFGTLVLSPQEVLDFERGAAVKMRG